jgi:hypothetical protein
MILSSGPHGKPDGTRCHLPRTAGKEEHVCRYLEAGYSDCRVYRSHSDDGEPRMTEIHSPQAAADLDLY